MYEVVKNKLAWELDKLWGLVQLPFRKEEVMARLSRSMSGLHVETTNICNADCIFCGYQYQERPTGVMSVELFEKIIDEYVACGGGHVGLTPTVGDPLVDGHLLERIRYARSKPEITTISMFSNMISLNKVGAAALIESGLTGLVVSTSGLDEEMYKRIYRSNQYKKVIANIKAFATENNARGRPVAFSVSMRADKPFWEISKYPDHVEIERLVGAENMGATFRYDSWSGRITPDQLTGTMRLRPQQRLHLTPCSELYTGPMVYWDGKVGACGCRDLDASELIIGNVSETHLGDIWFGAEIQRLRDEFLTDKIQPICKSCVYYSDLSAVLKRTYRDRYNSIAPSPYTPAPAAAAPARHRSLPIIP